MATVIVVQHTSVEGPGTIAEALADRGHVIRWARRDDPPMAPSAVDDSCGLVLMGGPMSVRDMGRDRHLQRSVALVQAALAPGLPVLGICLGSQLLASALGADVRAGARNEIGWHPIRLTEDAASDPLFAGVDRTFEAFHWHADVFDLPAGAVALASSEATAVQAFRWQSNAYGLLCHLEVDGPAIADMSAAFDDELEQAGLTAGEVVAASTADRIATLQRIGAVVFGRWATLVEEAHRDGRRTRTHGAD